MQTFLPIATTNFNQIAKVLDNKRLNKQALEGWQIMMVLWELDPDGHYRKPKGWANHPAVKMWQGAETVLALYVFAMTDEWKRRGFSTTIDARVTNTLADGWSNGLIYKYGEPPWWMKEQSVFEEIASTHRQALLFKDYTWYSQFNWKEDAKNGYTYKWV
jgi:Pyrimidine dimer DNA glycosylase